MKTVTLITGNENKATEMGRLLGIEVLHTKLSLPEIQDLSVAKVAELKAEAAYREVGSAVLVDDTGLYIDAWKGLPGAFIAWFLDSVGVEGILLMIKAWEDRSARVVTALGYCDEQGVKVFVGEVAGAIPEQARGDGGFGYDPIFIPEGQSKTFAEMSAEEKDACSMRALAAAQMKAELKF
ncbi:MAG TPA: RdgB/HAM1 family non-canonical purine NTP pyrophosphatase [Candidatus Saccharimonadales bacterium]